MILQISSTVASNYYSVLCCHPKNDRRKFPGLLLRLEVHSFRSRFFLYCHLQAFSGTSATEQTAKGYVFNFHSKRSNFDIKHVLFWTMNKFSSKFFTNMKKNWQNAHL
jgi:hypothetical protein